MRMHSKLLAAALLLAGAVQAAPVNVTLGKAVTASGPYGVLGPTGVGLGWCDGGACPPAALSSLTDGVMLAESTHWQLGTVWWDENDGVSPLLTFDIELSGLFEISDFLVQGDNNETYYINFRDALGDWHGWAAAGPIGGWGMTTRGGTAGPVQATALRVGAFGGDAFYSLSEVQVMGTALPEPASLALVGLGALAAGLSSRRRRSA